jgi:Holliday junction DNA helicase RuvA
MLDYIRGRIISKLPTQLVLEADGIGYRLHVPLSTFEKVPDHGEVKLLTQMVIKDDRIKLFGFASTEERELFELLLSISGIGSSTALTILSGSSVRDFRGMVLNSDSKALGRIKGIGRKTADRIILELKEVMRVSFHISAASPQEQETQGIISDAITALVSLGYSRPLAEKAVNDALRNLDSSAVVETLIKESLKHT